MNWDHTGVNIVPGSQWTMEEKGQSEWNVQVWVINAELQLLFVQQQGVPFYHLR